jgi:hypothetical protein
LVYYINLFIFATYLYKYIMEKQFSEQESLELINQMINSAKNNLQKGMGNVFLLWGYLVAFTSLVNMILLIMLPDRINHYSYYIWYMMPVGLVLHYFLIRKILKINTVKTYVDKIMSYVWIAFTISVLVLVIAMILATVMNSSGDRQNQFDFPNWIHWIFMTPFMLILYGFALFVSGKAYQFKPLVIGAFICWAFTAAIFTMVRTEFFMELQLAALFVSVVSGFIVPGHLLNKKEKSHV